MQVEKVDGSTVLTNGATLADVERTLKDKSVTCVSIHKQGDVVQIKGKRFRIGENGHWIPVGGVGG